MQLVLQLKLKILWSLKIPGNVLEVLENKKSSLKSFLMIPFPKFKGFLISKFPLILNKTNVFLKIQTMSLKLE